MQNFSQLQHLDLSDNQITNISLSFFLSYKSLDDFIFDYNPLESPPLEIIEKGRNSIIAWLSKSEKK